MAEIGRVRALPLMQVALARYRGAREPFWALMSQILTSGTNTPSTGAAQTCSTTP